MRIERETVIAAPRAKVWDIVANIADNAHLLAGVTRWTPLGDTNEVGARFDVRLDVGSAQLGSVIEITEWVDECEFAWASLSGIDHRGRFTLRDGDDDEHTRLRFRLTYTAPGGLLGYAAGRLALPMLRDSVSRTVRAIKHHAEDGAELVPREPLPGRAARAVGEIVDAVETVTVLNRAGMLQLFGPGVVSETVRALRKFGFTLPTAVAAAAAECGDRIAIVDEAGAETYAELQQRTDALAAAFHHDGVGAGDAVGVLCRNHRVFAETVVALAKLGADALLLNTSFSGPQIVDVLEREKVAALVVDAEFDELAREAVPVDKRYIAWGDGEPDTRRRSINSVIERSVTRGVEPAPTPSKPGRQVILTSGTTGTPKGARRGGSTGIEPLVAFLSRVPLRAGETTVIAPPLFHAWGFAHLTLGLLLRSTMVVRRKFEPETTLHDVARNKASVLVAVPVMLQRILEVPPESRSAIDTSSLRVVALSGSALPARLATDFMDEFGDVVYNLYGSTEVAWAAIATPADLRLVPEAAGRPPRGTIVKIVDDNGVEVLPGTSGRIFVGNSLGFEGYTDGNDKSRLGGLISTGDLGHWDWSGQLVVDGREDDMIVSGGENVFPREVEDVLSEHEQVVDVAVIGVPDDTFGAALEAFVVIDHSGAVTEDDLRQYVKANLAGFKVPRAVSFVDELPRNATGKVVKRDLADRGQDRTAS